MSSQRELALDLDVPSRIARLPLKKGERELLLVLADLAGDDEAWSGPQQVLAERLGCAPATVGRRAKRAAAAGYLDLASLPGRPARYRLQLAGPAAAPPSDPPEGEQPPGPSAESAEGPRTARVIAQDLRATCWRVLGLLVELVATAAPPRNRAQPPTKRRRIESDPRQLELWPPTFLDEPPTIAAPKPPATPPISALTPNKIDATPANSPRSPDDLTDTIDLPLPSTSTLPSHPSRTISTSGGRPSGIRWGRRIADEEFRDPAALQRLYEIAERQGFVSADERLLFFALCLQLDRTRTPQDKPPQLLTWLLNQRTDKFGKTWQARASTDEDLARAREWIRRLDVPAELQARTSDLAAADPTPSAAAMKSRLLDWQQKRTAG